MLSILNGDNYKLQSISNTDKTLQGQLFILLRSIIIFEEF